MKMTMSLSMKNKAMMSVFWNDLNETKCRRQLASRRIPPLGTHARTDGRTTGKHNSSGLMYWIGGCQCSRSHISRVFQISKNATFYIFF